MNCEFYFSFLMFALLQVLLTMLIHTCFFFACLPLVSHVWGRVGQGKEPTCPRPGLFPAVWLSPALAQPLPEPFPVAVAPRGGTFPITRRIPGGCCALVSDGEALNSLFPHMKSSRRSGDPFGEHLHPSPTCRAHPHHWQQFVVLLPCTRDAFQPG